MKVLVVDDDLILADVISFTLRRAGYEVIMAHDGVSAIEYWQAESPALIVLDLNLQQLDGLTVCQKIRAQGDTPIIILSVRNKEDDIVSGLKCGADDYMVKPFSPRQLLARIEALLRRAGSSSPATPIRLSVGDLTLDRSRHEVYRDGQPFARLTHLESRLMEVLMNNAEQVLSAETIINYVWGPAGGDKIILKQLIYRLRRKIEPQPSDPTYLETIVGMGYILIPHIPNNS